MCCRRCVSACCSFAFCNGCERTRRAYCLEQLTGVAIASTYLTKLSNLPLIVIAVAVILARLGAIVRRSPRAGLIALVALLLCAAVPIGSWMLWLKLQFGDLTGSTAKIAFARTGRENRSSIGGSIRFSAPHGLWVFWSDLIATFWRGEVEWHGRPLRWQIADRTVRRFFAAVYCGSGPRIEKTSCTFRIPTTGHCRCNSDCCSRSRFSWAAFNSIRFWQLR